MDKRQAVEFLEYLRQDRNLERTIYGDALNIAIEALKAQLSHEGTTKDAISRQQALDAVGKYASVWMEYTDAMSKDEIAQIALNNAKSTMIRILKELPTAQPEPTYEQVEEYCKRRCLHVVTDDFFESTKPQRLGHWIQYDKRFPWRHHYKCSECGNYLDFSGVNGGRGEANYCPNCGARMRGEQDGH